MKASLKILCVLSLSVTLVACSRNNNPYDLDIISDIEKYEKVIQQDSNKRLIEIDNYLHDVLLDIRYATKNNFTGEVIYNEARAFVRLPVLRALKKVQKDLNQKGLGLKIYDAYRPYTATLKFYEVYPDTMFVAAPWHGSRHNRGCAVDVNLVDLSTGKELNMPSAFDDFSEKAHPSFQMAADTMLQNRDYLINIMTKHGFRVYPYEWWHFDYQGWEDYKLLDLSFDDLVKSNTELVFIE